MKFVFYKSCPPFPIEQPAKKPFHVLFRRVKLSEINWTHISLRFVSLLFKWIHKWSETSWYGWRNFYKLDEERLCIAQQKLPSKLHFFRLMRNRRDGVGDGRALNIFATSRRINWVPIYLMALHAFRSFATKLNSHFSARRRRRGRRKKSVVSTNLF